MLVVPTAPPRANATTVKASQPKMAVFRCAALQRPIRAARLEWCGVRDMLVPPSFDTTDATDARWRGRRREVRIGLRPDDDAGSYPGRTTARPRRCPVRRRADSRRRSHPER